MNIDSGRIESSLLHGEPSYKTSGGKSKIKCVNTRPDPHCVQTIKTELLAGRIVRLRNFGTFQARKSHGQVRARFDDSKNFFKNLS